MKQKPIRFAKRYETALRTHLKQGTRESLRPAIRLGRAAVALDLETLELARMHERALVVSEAVRGESRGTKRAQAFFNEVLKPMVEINRAARGSGVDLSQLNEMLSQRTRELAATNDRLERGLVRRRRVEAAIKKHGESDARRLQESLLRQERLRQATYKSLSAQEKERKAMSHHLQDEVVQTLLAVQIRLQNLQGAARGRQGNLRKEIASTQRVVEESVKSINRFARELGLHSPW